MNLVDSQLYRPLKSGTEFEGLIPAYQGLDHKFDKKKDNHTTYDTLRFMAQWATKYASQMSKVAPKLKANTLEQTVNNIYSFLYNHFQYKLDGALQNLYSPSAAWHFRKTGFDCKTYSILASTILQNLNIPHAFRMVQQAGIMPGEWSHVYVIVPNGKSYYLIDATTHTNKEVSFTKKYDYNMEHRGLAAPFIEFTGLGCACQGTPIQKSGLGSPAVMANTVKNFHNFLNVLESNGISREVTNRMLAMVKWNIENGIDPNMGQILAKSLATTPQQGLGVIESVSSLSSMGSTYGDTTYSLPKQVAPTKSPTQFDVLVGEGKTALNNVSIGGVNVMSTATQLLSGDFIGAGLNILKNVIPIEKTFGAVFANGFDLSCWGSSYNETEAKKDIQGNLPFMVKWSGIYNSPTTENLNKFLLINQNYYLDATDPKRKNYAKCTRKGHALVAKALLKHKEDVLQEFKTQGFNLIPTGKRTETIPVLPYPEKNGGKGFRWGNGVTTYDSYQVIPPQQAQQATQQKIITNPDGSQSVVTTTNNNNTTTEKKSNIGTLVTIGSAIALGAKLLL